MNNPEDLVSALKAQFSKMILFLLQSLISTADIVFIQAYLKNKPRYRLPFSAAG